MRRRMRSPCLPLPPRDGGMCEATLPKSYTCAPNALLMQVNHWTDEFRRQSVLECPLIHQGESPLAARDGRFLVEVHGCSKTWVCFLVK